MSLPFLSEYPFPIGLSQNDGPYHFAPGYFGKVFRLQLPDLDASEQAYRMSRQAYQDAGREVVDVAIGRKLQNFPQVEYSPPLIDHA